MRYYVCSGWGAKNPTKYLDIAFLPLIIYVLTNGRHTVSVHLPGCNEQVQGLPGLPVSPG